MQGFAPPQQQQLQAAKQAGNDANTIIIQNVNANSSTNGGNQQMNTLQQQWNAMHQQFAQYQQPPQPPPQQQQQQQQQTSDASAEAVSQPQPQNGQLMMATSVNGANVAQNSDSNALASSLHAMQIQNGFAHNQTVHQNNNNANTEQNADTQQQLQAQQQQALLSQAFTPQQLQQLQYQQYIQQLQLQQQQQQQMQAQATQIPPPTTGASTAAAANESSEGGGADADAGGDSKLNAEVAEFVPTSLGMDQTQSAESVQEQLFIQLQNINTEMTNLKRHMDAVLTPTIMQCAQNLLVYQANPQLLLSSQQHQLQYLQLQQQQQMAQNELTQVNFRYQQLQQNLATTQAMYQQCKDPAYHVMDDETFNAHLQAQALEQGQVQEQQPQPVMPPPPAPPAHTQEADIETETKKPDDGGDVIETERRHQPKEEEEEDDDDEEQEEGLNDEEEEEEEEDEGYDEDDVDLDSDEDARKDFADGEVHYDVMQLIDLQARFLDIEWRQHRDIPFDVRLVSKGVKPERYMKDVVAMFKRKSKNPWLAASHTGNAPTDEAERLVKRLTGVLNKMTPEKFDKVAKMSMDIVNEFANTQDQMEVIIGLVLQFGIKQPVFGSQYAELCKHLFDHLHKIALVCEHKWVQEDPNLADTFRRMVIQQTNELFSQHRNHSPDDLRLNAAGQRITDPQELELKISKKKRAFFAILVLVAELYNVDLLKRSLVYRGVFDELLKSGRVTSVDIEGLCRVFKHCGPKLERVQKKAVDKYLHKLAAQAPKFDFRTKVLVEEVQEMRSNNWQARLKKETAKTKEEIRDEFEAEQQPKHDKRRRGDKRSQYDDGGYGGYGYDGGYDNGYGGGDVRGSSYRSVGNLAIPLKTNNASSSPSKFARRGDARAQSSRELQSSRKGSSSRYGNDNRSWDKDNARANGGGGGGGGGGARYVLSPSKSYGGATYQKKQSSSNDSHSSSKTSKVETRLRNYIDLYLQGGDTQDIVALNCTDIKVWSHLIFDHLMELKPKEVDYFIDLVRDLFDHGTLSNKSNRFVVNVVQLLAEQFDEAMTDCPKFDVYVAKLCTTLCVHEHLSITDCFSSFIKVYQQNSGFPIGNQNKKIKKLVDRSVDEATRLKASRSFINKLSKVR